MYLKCWLELFICDFIVKHHTLPISLMHFSIKYSNTCKTSIDTDQYMQKQERQKPFIIPTANTLIQPNAVMIKLFNTDITRFTMLWPSWFFNFACFAFRFFFEHDLIIWIPFLCNFGLSFVIYYTWINHTSLVKTVIANEHEEWTCIFVIIG